MRLFPCAVGMIVAVTVLACAYGSTTKPSTQPARSTWNEPETENVKSQDGFGAQLWLTRYKKFFDSWKKEGDPHLTPLTTAKRNEAFYAVVLFAEPAANERGLADVTYDLTVRRPDGSVYGEGQNLNGMQDRTPRPRV